MPSYIPPHRRPSGAAALEKGSTPIPPNKGDKKLLQIADILEGNSLSIKANKEAIETLSKGALELGKLVRSHGRSAIIDRDFMATRIGDLERRIDRMQKGLKLAAAEVAGCSAVVTLLVHKAGHHHAPWCSWASSWSSRSLVELGFNIVVILFLGAAGLHPCPRFRWCS